MSLRAHIVASALIAAVLATAGPVTAQPAAEDLPGESAPDEATAPANEGPFLPRDTSEEAVQAQLDALFDQLARSKPGEWQIVQQQIWRLWQRSGSDSMDFLLRRGMDAMEENDYDTALVHLNDLVRLAPDFAEGWNQRATLHFLMGNYGRSMRDIERTLALEPRHFGAMAGLGIILDRTGNKAGALGVYRRALELHPYMPGAQDGIDRLAPEVDGREL